MVSTRGSTLARKKTKLKNYRFSDEVLAMLDEMATHHGLNQTALLEVVIRAYYRAEFRRAKSRKQAEKPGEAS